MFSLSGFCFGFLFLFSFLIPRTAQQTAWRMSGKMMKKQKKKKKWKSGLNTCMILFRYWKVWLPAMHYTYTPSWLCFVVESLSYYLFCLRFAFFMKRVGMVIRCEGGLFFFFYFYWETNVPNIFSYDTKWDDGVWWVLHFWFFVPFLLRFYLFDLNAIPKTFLTVFSTEMHRLIDMFVCALLLLVIVFYVFFWIGLFLYTLIDDWYPWNIGSVEEWRSLFVWFTLHTSL